MCCLWVKRWHPPPHLLALMEMMPMRFFPWEGSRETWGSGWRCWERLVPSLALVCASQFWCTSRPITAGIPRTDNVAEKKGRELAYASGIAPWKKAVTTPGHQLQVQLRSLAEEGEAEPSHVYTQTFPHLGSWVVKMRESIPGRRRDRWVSGPQEKPGALGAQREWERER